MQQIEDIATSRGRNSIFSYRSIYWPTKNDFCCAHNPAQHIYIARFPNYANYIQKRNQLHMRNIIRQNG